MAKGFTEISNEYLAGIDQEIERLRTLKSQITELLGAAPAQERKKQTRKAGRPAKKQRRQLSPEARERIAAAQRKRWAAQKRAVKSAKKAPAKKAAAKKAAPAKAAKKAASSPATA